MYNLIHFIVTALLVILIILDILFLQGRLKFNMHLGTMFGLSLICFDEVKTPLFLIVSIILGLYIALELLGNYVIPSLQKFNKVIRSIVYTLSVILLVVETVILFSIGNPYEQVLYVITLFITFMPIGMSVTDILGRFDKI